MHAFRKFLLVIIVLWIFWCILIFWEPSSQSHDHIPLLSLLANWDGRMDPKSDESEGLEQATFLENVTSPGVIVIWKVGISGVGNQLFQYACSYALAKRKQWPLYIDYRDGDPNRRQFQPEQREFALDQFHVPMKNLVRYGTTKLAEQVLFLTDEQLMYNTFDQSHKFLSPSDNCQSEYFFKEYEDDIRIMFQPRKKYLNLTKLEKLISEIEGTESVAVHVRRGDFLRTLKYFTPIAFQRKAISLMVDTLNRTRGVTTPTFFVFSDDIPHAKLKFQDFAKKYKFVYVTGNRSIEDFYLMMICKHIIFPNSTFSWWAAYLNKNEKKVVITSAFNPKYWNRRSWSSDYEFYMKKHGTLYHKKEWIVIDPFTGGL